MYIVYQVDDAYINHLIAEHLEEEVEKNTREYL